MTEPALDPLPDELSELLEAERHRPDAEVAGGSTRDRVRSRLGVTLGPLALGGPPVPTAPPPGSAVDPGAATTALGAGLSALLAKPAAIGLLALGLAGGAGWYALRAPDALPAAPPSQPAAQQLLSGSAERPLDNLERPATAAPAEQLPPPAAEPVGEPAPQSDPQPSPVASNTPSAASAAPAPAERDTDLAAERRLLEAARQAVTRGDAAGALASLRQHAREFPRGRLSEEREVLWIRSLVVAGRRGEAIERASRYKKAHPRSLLLPSLEQSLGPIP